VPVALRKIIGYGDIVPLLEQEADSMRSNVSGAACNEDLQSHNSCLDCTCGVPSATAVFATIVTIIPESAIYPGSFDPITNGHLDLIQRGSRLFDRLIVSVLRNETKEPLFSAEERMAMLNEVVGKYPNVAVDSFAGLLVDHAGRHSATVLLRGIRAISDYEYELQMALMNRRLNPGLETVFLLANEAYSFISSRLVKEVFALGGNISGLVPPSVEARLKRRMSQLKRKGA
jgi:pantetheine-phosphate adenylyltransferase